MPATLPSTSSHSPVCRPARNSRPSSVIAPRSRRRSGWPARGRRRRRRSRRPRCPLPARGNGGVGGGRARGVARAGRARRGRRGGQPLARADDVGEQDGGEHAVGSALFPTAGLPDLGQEARFRTIVTAVCPGGEHARRRAARRAGTGDRARRCSASPRLHIGRGCVDVSVGTLIAGSTWRTSISLFITASASTAPGLALCRR